MAKSKGWWGKARELGGMLFGMGGKTPSWLWPFFIAAAGAPIVGYELERRREGKAKRREGARRAATMAALPGDSPALSPVARKPFMAPGLRPLQNPYLPFPLYGMAPKMAMAKAAAARRRAKLVVSRALGTVPIKEAGMGEMGVLLQKAKLRAKNRPGWALRQGVDSKPKEDHPVEERREARRGAGAGGTVGGSTYGV